MSELRETYPATPSAGGRAYADTLPPLTPAAVAGLLMASAPWELAALFMGTLDDFGVATGYNADWWSCAGTEGALYFCQMPPGGGPPVWLGLCLNVGREEAPPGWIARVAADAGDCAVRLFFRGDYAGEFGPPQAA